MKYCIGDTVVCINVEEQNLHSNFQAFRCDESEEPQLTIDIVEEPEMTMNIQMTVGQIMLMESEEIGVFEGAMGIDLLYPKNVLQLPRAIAVPKYMWYRMQRVNGRKSCFWHCVMLSIWHWSKMDVLYWIPRRCLLMAAV